MLSSTKKQIKLFNFLKELGLNSSSKFLRSGIKSTRISGFVLIRLGARAMIFFVRKFVKSRPPPVDEVLLGVPKGLLGIDTGRRQRRSRFEFSVAIPIAPLHAGKR